jgi:hypothetical protein
MVHHLAGSLNYPEVPCAFHQTLQTNFRIEPKIRPQQHAPPPDFSVYYYPVIWCYVVCITDNIHKQNTVHQFYKGNTKTLFKYLLRFWAGRSWPNATCHFDDLSPKQNPSLPPASWKTKMLHKTVLTYSEMCKPNRINLGLYILLWIHTKRK